MTYDLSVPESPGVQVLRAPPRATMASGQWADGNTRSMDDEDRIPVASAGNTEAECEVTLAAMHTRQTVAMLQCAECFATSHKCP